MGERVRSARGHGTRQGGGEWVRMMRLWMIRKCVDKMRLVSTSQYTQRLGRSVYLSARFRFSMAARPVRSLSSLRAWLVP